MGRIFVIVGGLLVLLLTAALVVPPFVDWSGYRADFEREASRVLGRPVKVAGDVSARLLPFPSLAFSDVRVGADAAHPVMTVDTFSMDAELMPFLRGQLLIFDMRVDRLRATISLDKSGKVDWAIRPSTPLDPTKIKLERLSVSDGTITLREEASGRSHTATGLNAVISANSLAGPWQANGSLVLQGEKLAIDLTSGEAKPDGSLRVRARISPEAIPATFETDGDVTVTEGRLDYAGDFSLRSSDMVAKTAKDQKTPTETPFFSGVRVTGKFKADRSHFDASEFRMEQGPADNPYVVNGKAFIDYGAKPRFEVSADGQQLFWGPNEAASEEQSGSAMPVADRIAIARRVLEQLPIPTIPGNVDLRLPAVIAGGTTIRSVTVSAEPDGKNWNIRQFAADLPGRTKVEAKGTLSVGKDFGFKGDMLVASRQPSGLASWLNETVDDSVRKLEGAGFSGQVDLRDGMQRIDNLEIALGKTTLKGSFVREVKGLAQPSIVLTFNGGAVDSEALQAFTAFFSSGDGLDFLDGQSLNLAFKAGPVRYQDMEAANVDMALRLHDGRFDFDRLLVGDVAGTTLTATGTYEPFSNTPSGSLDATILSGDLSRFLSLMANRYPQLPLFHALSLRAANFPGLFEDSEINVIANAVAPSVPVANKTPAKGAASKGKSARPAEANTKSAPGVGEFSFSVTGKTGGMKLDLSGTASGGEGEGEPLQMQLNGTATSEQGEAVLALIGLPALPLGLAGELTADLSMQGAPSAGMRTLLKLTAPDGLATADGVISLVGGDIAASGKAQLKSADLQPFIATAGFALPGFGEGLSADLASDFQFAKGILRFPNLTGKLDGEDVSARLEANFADSGLPQLKGEAKLATLEVDSLAAIMLGQDAFEPAKPTTKTIWPRGAFAVRPSLPLLLDMKLNVAQAHMEGFGTATEFSTRLLKTMDSLQLNELTGNWAGGYLVGNVSLSNSDKNALLLTELKWSGAKLKDFYQLENGSAPLGGVVKAAVNLNGGGESVAALVGSLAGAASFDVENFTVDGLDGAALPAMIAAADATGDQFSGSDKLASKQFVGIADKATGQGTFAPGNARFDFTISGGVARMAAANLSDGNAALLSDLQFDLSTLGIGGNGTLTFQNGDGADTGISPQVAFSLGGSYSAPEVSFDKQPLVQFLTQRALEREQERVESMQASLMEKQRLRRQLGLFEADEVERDRSQREDEVRRRAEASAREAARKTAAEAQRLEAVKPQGGPAGGSKDPLASPEGGQSLNEFLKSLETTPVVPVPQP
ncbi:AsmA family protein [Brucella sp. MAB-22]|uniref:AsmA family protein n=1 Tax=Brucella TaxID=234 RepID=UPI000F6813E3|nr:MULTISPECIES: AsmA family protein [Brucella]RRY21611.1 AsmA family protein [Brucella anthropi]UYT55799.1 AsmA family protein [Brucella sp. MAB-22]